MVLMDQAYTILRSASATKEAIPIETTFINKSDETVLLEKSAI